MKGWFDAFRNDGGPTLYNFNNRTAVTGDITLITFLTIFSTLYVAFLIIFPGIRKEVSPMFFYYLILFVVFTFAHTIILHLANNSISNVILHISKLILNLCVYAINVIISCSTLI